MSETIYLTKSSGEQEPFSRDKLMRSLRKAGASTELAESVWLELEGQLESGMSSQLLWRQAFRLLSELRRAVAARYSLKRAIMELGPSGYPFEHLMGELFRRRGYAVQVGQVLKGHCVTHEIDVVGEKNGELLLVECKYRNTPGFKCDVKVPLYIRSRFEDVRMQRQLPPENISGWITTNARFSGDAIQYARCVGLKLMGWDYPAEDSLGQWLDRLRLYPLTVLTSLHKADRQWLLAQGLVTCDDLLARPELLEKRPTKPGAASVERILEECRRLSEA
ncbi:MAG: restriction endonuclease [Candidatus Sericytochromatia bacterium]